MSQSGSGHAPQPVPEAVVQGAAVPTGAAQFLSNNGIYAPLVGVDPNDVLSGGYGWLSPTDYDAYGVPHSLHPGLDLNSGSGGNADCGLPVCAPVDCVVEAVLPWNGGSGEGNHLWLRTEDSRAVAPAWVHYDHLQAIHVGVGQAVMAGQTVGLCGASGGWDWCHLHLELARERPASYYQWPYGWSRAAGGGGLPRPQRLVLGDGGEGGRAERGAVPPAGSGDARGLAGAQLGDARGVAGGGRPLQPGGAHQQGVARGAAGGTLPGPPLTDDRRYGEGEQAGHWAEFAHGLVATRTEGGEWSWNG